MCAFVEYVGECVCVVLETEQKRLFGLQILKVENPDTTCVALLLLSRS